MRSRQKMVRILGLGLMASVLVMTGCKKKSEKKSESKDTTKTEARAPARPGDKGTARPAARSNKAARSVSVGSLASGPVSIVVGLQMAPVKASPVWALIQAKLAEATKDPEYKTFVTTCKVDPVQAMESAEIAFGSDFLEKKGESKDMAIVIRGKFDGPALIKCLKPLLAKSKKDLKELQVGGKPALSYKSKKGDTVIVIGAAKGVLAMASPKMSTLAASGDLMSSSPRLKALKGGLPGNALAWVLFGKIPLKAGSMGPFGAMLKGVKEIAGGNLYLAGSGTNWNLVMHADMGSADAAKKLIKVVDMVKGLVAMQAGKLPPQAKPALALLNKMKTKVEGTNMVLTIPVDKAAMKAAAAMADKK